jgi:hypothetical protein
LTQGSVSKQNTRLDAYDRAVQNLIADFGAIKAPKKWVAFKAGAAKDLATFELALGQYATKVTPKSSVASVTAADQAFRAAGRAPAKRLNHRFDGHGLFRCGSAL